MPITYTFDEEQTGTLTGVLLDNLGSPMGSGDISTLLITITDQITKKVINNRYRQNAFNDNDVTIDGSGNLTWNIQADDNIIVSAESTPGTVERHEILFEWTWGSSKYSNELYYFDITQVSEIGDVGSNVYGSILEANAYLTTRLNTRAWTNATNADKLAALTEATRAIDNLNFKGSKTVSTQYLEFPRGGDTIIPNNIKYATFEIALKIIDGADPESEIEMLRSETQQYGSVRESYQRGVFPEWIMAGIISARAWQMLKPFLRDPRILVITRES